MVSVWDAKQQLPARDATDISSELRNEDTAQGIVCTLQSTISTGKVFFLGMLSVTTLETDPMEDAFSGFEFVQKTLLAHPDYFGSHNTIIIFSRICAGNFILGCENVSVDIGEQQSSDHASCVRKGGSQCQQILGQQSGIHCLPSTSPNIYKRRKIS